MIDNSSCGAYDVTKMTLGDTYLYGTILQMRKLRHGWWVVEQGIESEQTRDGALNPCSSYFR